MTQILLVEDNPITCKLVRTALGLGQYTVREAHDSVEAIQAFRENPISLVLLDLVLPDSDGYSVLEKLRQEPRGDRVPILAFSGMLTPYDDERIAEMGFDDFVTKPIEPSRLLQIVRAHLPVATQRLPIRRRTLVVADDDPVQRKLVTTRLQRAGYEVVAATDGEEALRLVEEHRPDAIVSDILMPRLDGFGLCMAVRQHTELANIPIVLISNSYLEAEDHALAKRVGADVLLLRTPDLAEVISVLESERFVQRMDGRESAGATDGAHIEHERVQRMTYQLERQLAHQATLSQRCSLLSAELSVLSAISEALMRSDNLELALHDVLATCFDAGGISSGILYLPRADKLHAMSFGTAAGLPEYETFFGHMPLLQSWIDNQTFVALPAESGPVVEGRELLLATASSSMLIAPLGYRGRPLGAMVTLSVRQDLQAPDRIAFAQAVAGQISVALALAQAFEAKDASEHEARSTATVLRSILESMADGVVVANANGVLTHVNHAAHGQRAAIEHPEFPLARALKGEAVDGAQIFVPEPDGDDAGRWLSITARPLVEDRPDGRGAVAVVRDVTIEKAAQSRLLVNDRMASLGLLAAGVGHEINNPLMAVLGNLEMATKDLDDLVETHGRTISFGDLPEALRDAHEAATRVRSIVRDLKLFSRADEDTRTRVDLTTVLESSLRLVGADIRHRARLIKDLQPVPFVIANESRLGQVFVNLIVNAMQAIPEGRAADNEIAVSTSVAPDGRVSAQVRDTGCGMPREVVNRLFTPFFTTKPMGVGTGLGLAICHQLVTAVGGEIRVDTAPGEGTTFDVLFPSAGGTA